MKTQDRQKHSIKILTLDNRQNKINSKTPVDKADKNKRVEKAKF